MLVVPLYAYDLGMSGTQIGALLGFPVIAQILLSLAGGVLTDRVGGRAMQMFSFSAMAMAGLVYSNAQGFASILLAQFLLITSRAVYWPAAQTIASNLPGARGVQLGRLSAITNVGQISGTTVAGLVLAQWSFTAAFLALTCMSTIAFVLSISSPLGQRQQVEKQVNILANFGPLFRQRSVYFSIVCAYMAALPTTLSHSFYPILMVDFGFPTEGVGGLLALRAAGAITVSLFIARYIHSSGGYVLPLIAMLGVAAGIGLIPLFSDALPVAAFLLGAGAGSGVMYIYYQILMSEISTSANRGTAMAVGGLGYGLSHLSTPLIMGYLLDTVGIANAFHLWGGIALLVTAAFIPLHRWAMKSPVTTLS